MSPPNRNQRVLTGYVTKILGEGDSYGFIDEEIFFQQCNVEKGPAKVYDRVYAECQYSESLPFKWNATKVTILKPSNQANSPNNPSSSEASYANNSSKTSTNQDNREKSASSITASPMLPVNQTQQQFNPHPHKQISTMPETAGHQSQDGPKHLLAPTTNPGEFFNPDIRGGVTPFMGQSAEGYQQQFSNHDPMLGANNKLTYTSQPGSAFVASQFVPYIPPSALAPQAIAQGGHHKNQDQVGSSRNQGGFQNKNNQSRWNERDTDRNADRKSNSNNNDNRRDKSRMNDNNNNRSNRGTSGHGGSSGSRDSSNNKNKNNTTNINTNKNSNNSNNNSNKGNSNRNKDDRDRRTDIHKRTSRDDASARLSPTPSTALSTTSNTSSSHGKSGRRRYEPVHLPKSPLMLERMSTLEIKQRYTSSLNIPSDLKEVGINSNFRFDITSIPKPICYKIEIPNKQTDDLLDKQSDSQMDVSLQSVKESSQTPAQVKMLHKYGVKVILVSLPTMEDIYKQLFGQNLDSYSSEINRPSHLNSIISFLCTKSLSNGSSLIGARFDPLLDGFLPEESSTQIDRPNIIATCVRCVRDQTGLDLSQCTEWTHLATFIYNKKDDYFSESATIEYSYIFMPNVWSLLTVESEKEFNSIKIFPEIKLDDITSDEKKEDSFINCDDDTTTIAKDNSTSQPQEALNQSNESHSLTDDNKMDDSDVPTEQQRVQLDERSPFDPNKLAELKVSDLKAELDRRNIKYKHGIKKAELLAKLKELLDSEEVREKVEEEIITDQAETIADTSVTVCSKIDTELNEDKVEGEKVADTVPEEQSSASTGVKRKSEDADEQFEKHLKKIDVVKSEAENIDKPVSLVSGQLKVKPKGLTTLATIPLGQAVLGQKHDQFELFVASNIFKDSLVQHFSEYIFTSLVTDKTGKNFTCKTSDSDEKSFKNPSSTKNSTSSISSNKDSVDLPIDRYMNVAFTYFDSTHIGYMLVDDLSKIFLNTGFSISLRALSFLLGKGPGEKFNYKSVPDLSCATVYKFPKQFSEYSLGRELARRASNYDSANKKVEFNGVLYDVEKLIQQSIASERIRVNMFERFNRAITKSDQQSESISKLEMSQKALSNALNIQNEEICELKREKEKLRQKNDRLRKCIEASISSFTDVIKKDD